MQREREGEDLDLDLRKRACRRTLRRRRRELPESERVARSTALERVLVAHPIWERAHGIAAFVGVRGEPETRGLIQLAQAAGKVVWLPRVLGGGKMRFWMCERLADLELGGMGLLEPPMIGEGVVAPGPEQAVDLMLVPGLGFGAEGARIGFGAGHYDRALARAASEGGTIPTLCGVCLAPFFERDAGAIPTQPHDFKMHYLATDAGVVASLT